MATQNNSESITIKILSTTQYDIISQDKNTGYLIAKCYDADGNAMMDTGYDANGKSINKQIQVMGTMPGIEPGDTISIKYTKGYYKDKKGNSLPQYIINDYQLAENQSTDDADKKALVELGHYVYTATGNNTFAEHILKIYKQYGPRSIEMLEKYPYAPVQDIGIPFDTIDNLHAAILEHNGTDPKTRLTESERIQAGILSVLTMMEKSGNCYSVLTDAEVQGNCDQIIANTKTDKNQKTITNQIMRTLKFNTQDKEGMHLVMDELNKMEKDGLIVKDGNKLYRKELYDAETNIATYLAVKITNNNGHKYSEENIKNSVAKLSHGDNIRYSDEQIKMIQNCLNNKVSILTGGPGTGKTTTIKGIIQAAKDQNEKINIIQAAPVGKAAVRMHDATNVDAHTIHKLLEANAEGQFKKNKNNKLEGDLLIIDESSMIDTELMSHLLDAVPDNMQIIFVGDEDQLPSVGPGRIFHDMIETKQIPVSRLTTTFRQGKDSQIVENAQIIRQDEEIKHMLAWGEEDLGKKGVDFVFIPENDPVKIQEKIKKLMTNDTLCKYCTDNQTVQPNDIQILSAEHKNLTGTKNLNKVIQEQLLKEGKIQNLYLQNGDTYYRKGDKVIQNINDYNKDVMNGDIGIITGIDLPNQTLTVDFGDGKENVQYEQPELTKLELAYATTVHKAQGSEYPVVIMPIFDSRPYHKEMKEIEENIKKYKIDPETGNKIELTKEERLKKAQENTTIVSKNLIYTAVTRAKKCFIVVGSGVGFMAGINNKQPDNRKTALTERIQNKITEINATHEKQANTMTQDQRIKMANDIAHEMAGGSNGNEPTNTRGYDKDGIPFGNDLTDYLTAVEAAWPETRF